MTSNKINTIKRGTSHPLGKSTKNKPIEALPRKLSRLKGKMRTEEGSASPPLASTSEKAASSASQSSDLRQNRRKPTPYQIASTITKKMVSKAAYPRAGNPLL